MTANGQYLYNYSSHKLYQASLAFPYQTVTPPAGGMLTIHEGTYYSWDGTDLTELTEEQVTALTEEQKAAAKTITFFYVDYDDTYAAVASPGVYLFDGVSLYVSTRQSSFTEVAMSATTVYYDPGNTPYQWQYGTLQRLAEDSTEGIQLTITTPDNWNSALEMAVRQTLFNYCVSYALYSWFTVTAPRISDKYLADTTQQLSALRQLIHEKKPPTCTVSPLSIKTEIE